MTDKLHHRLQTQEALQREFRTTFLELAERTTNLWALEAMAATVAKFAATTVSPSDAVEEFFQMVRRGLRAVQREQNEDRSDNR